MNIQEKIARDQKKYGHLRNPNAKPGYRISSAYQDYLKSAKRDDYELDFTREDLIQHLYSLGYSELYARWRDSGVKSEHMPKLMQKKVTKKITLDNIFITTLHEMEEDYKQGLKRCTTCDVKKSLDNFSKQAIGVFGLYPRCKECVLEYSRTIPGLTSVIWSGQKTSSRQRKHPKPDYTKEELSIWMHENGLEGLYKDWVVSGHDKDLRPSVDRVDSLKPYTLDNLELVTWKENNGRAHEDRRKGVGASGKTCKPAYQYTLDGDFVAEHFSAREAYRATGIGYSNILSVLNGSSKTAGGFVWKKEKD